MPLLIPAQGTLDRPGGLSIHHTEDRKLSHSDGGGAGGRFPFATLTGAPAIGAPDFVVI